MGDLNNKCTRRATETHDPNPVKNKADDNKNRAL